MARPVALPPRDRNRDRPRHSYEGFVEKRGPRDQPLEVLDLGELVAVQAEGGGLVLRLRGQEVTLKAESQEAQEMWWGFILTMAELKVPTDLALLPGRVFRLSEALCQERDRRATPGSPPAPPSHHRPWSPPASSR